MKNISLPTTLLLALSLAAGCGPASDSKEQAGPPVAERLEKAKELLDQARTAGADKVDPVDFEGQEKKLDDAQKAIDDGKPDRAKSKIRSAEAGLKELVAKLESLKKSRDTGLAEKKKAQKAIADAVRSKAEVGNKEAFDEIRALMAQTDAELDGSNLAKVTAAPRNYQ